MGLYRYRNRTSKWFIALIRPLLWMWLQRHYNIELKISKEMAEMEGPYLLIGNHVTFWDPFMIGIPLKPDTRYITSDNVFRTRFFRWVMSQVGAIPKTKAVANADIVRRIVGVIKQKGVIGIFPEAQRTWDGRTINLVPQVPKLVKRLKLPVVAARISGGYLSGPRWGRKDRRGKVLIEYSFAVSPQEAGKLELDEVVARMENAIRFNPDTWQREARIPFKGSRNAEYLERVLFTCPPCGKIGSLESERDILTCTSCGYTVRYLDTGFFEAVDGELHFESVPEWNSWQAESLAQLLDAGSESPLFTDRGARLWTGYMSKPLQLIERGEAEFRTEAVLFRSASGTVRRFPMNEIDGANVQNGEKLEFYFNNELFRLDFGNPRTSAYKWLRAILHMQGDSAQLSCL
jgi:1-acyl-sn-glycerol-3-phosphate acyltransferase